MPEKPGPSQADLLKNALVELLQQKEALQALPEDVRAQMTQEIFLKHGLDITQINSAIGEVADQTSNASGTIGENQG